MSAIPEVRTVCFVGAGTMGCYNALLAALAGYQAVLYDANPDSLAVVPTRQEEMAAMIVAAGFCSQSDVNQAATRIRCSGDLSEAVADAQLVSESVYEDLALKRDIHRQLDAVAHPDVVLTTNSSALLISDIEDVVRRGERIAALHSHLGSPLIDIVPGPRTSAATIEMLRRYALSLRAEPLVLNKENPGYVLNALLGPVIGTSLALCVNGDYTARQIDLAWMRSQGGVMGPFGMIDLFGLPLIRDTWLHRNREDALQAFRDPILALLQPMIDANQLGMQSGAGFYRYPEPDYQSREFALEDAETPLMDLLQNTLVAHGLVLAMHDIAAPMDIDRAWRIGTGLSKGPFEHLREQGVTASEIGFTQLRVRGLLSDADSAKLLEYLASYGNALIQERNS